MKLILEKQNLLDALTNVSRAVSPKSPMPVLEGILFSAGESTLTLTGYDLDMGITTTISAQVSEPGEIVLSARLIVDIVRRLPRETVELSVDEKMLCSIRSGRSAFQLMGADAADYPKLPQADSTSSFAFPQYLLKEMIGQTRYAISQSDAMPVHKGSQFNLDGQNFDLVSVDGCRLALRQEPYPCETPVKFVVPGKTLSDLEKMLSDDRDGENADGARGEEQVVVTPCAKHVVFTLGTYQIVTRQLEGNFLDYRSVIPSVVKTQVTLNTRELVEAVDRAALVIEDRLKNPLCFDFHGSSVTISVNTTTGHAEDEVDCSISGDPIRIGFNAGYLLDALKNANCDQVTMKLSGAVSAMTIEPADGKNFTFLVLPVRIKN